MNILNEEFKSNFLKKLNKNFKNNYNEDYENQWSFIEDATKLLKQAYAYKDLEDNSKNKQLLDKFFDDEINLFSKYHIDADRTSDMHYIKDFLGYNDYGRKFEYPKRNYVYIKYAKEALSHLITPNYSYYNSVVRTHNTSSNSVPSNDFSFITKIFRNYNYDLNNLTDDQIEKLDKLPKIISDNSKLSGKFIFWFKSEEPDNEELLDSDKLVGISYGSEVYWPEPSNRRDIKSIKIKDLSDDYGYNANKAYAILNSEEQYKSKIKKQNERRDSRTIYKYEEIFEKPYYINQSDIVILDELPEPTKDSPKCIEIDGQLYYKSVLNNFGRIDYGLDSIISNNEFVRDAQYKQMIEDKIQYYKTIIKRNKLNNEGNDFDNKVNIIISKTHEYLYKTKNIKTQNLRTIYQKLDKILEYYNDYLRYKKDLINNYSDYANKNMQERKNNCIKLINDLLKTITA